MKVSFLVPARNEEATIGAVLDAIAGGKEITRRDGSKAVWVPLRTRVRVEL